MSGKRNNGRLCANDVQQQYAAITKQTQQWCTLRPGQGQVDCYKCGDCMRTTMTNYCNSTRIQMFERFLVVWYARVMHEMHFDKLTCKKFSFWKTDQVITLDSYITSLTRIPYELPMCIQRQIAQQNRFIFRIIIYKLTSLCEGITIITQSYTSFNCKHV